MEYTLAELIAEPHLIEVAKRQWKTQAEYLDALDAKAEDLRRQIEMCERLLVWDAEIIQKAKTIAEHHGKDLAPGF